jgi:putative glutamine amidotransferase
MMKKLTTFFLVMATAILAFSCQTGAPKQAADRAVTVVLTNPTVDNLKTIQFLTEKQIFAVPADVKYLCVYHPSQTYKFERTENYIAENNLTNFILSKVEGELNEQNIFAENNSTETLKKLFDESDGIIFFGGPDIPPTVWGEENTLSVVTDPGRHYFELTFLFHLLGSSRNEEHVPFLEEKPDYLVTGFCLGMQTMNVATGGSLYQDIPADLFGLTTPEEKVAQGQEYMHRNYWQEIVKDSLLMGVSLHTIQFTEHPFFGETINLDKEMRPLIYSSHHQSINQIGKGFEVTALSPDGKVIEGIAHNKYPNVFSIQFHPEVPALYENRAVKKFTPTDTPRTYHEMIGEEGLAFHKAYWAHISKALIR